MHEIAYLTGLIEMQLETIHSKTFVSGTDENTLWMLHE